MSGQTMEAGSGVFYGVSLPYKKAEFMSTMLRTAILFTLCVAFCGTTVRGTGPNVQSIKFVNASSVQVGVTTTPTSAAITAALTAESQTAFTTAGGIILNAGGTTTFSVQAGTNMVGASNWSNANPATGTILTQITESVYVPANQTVTVTVNGSGTPVVLSF